MVPVIFLLAAISMYLHVFDHLYRCHSVSHSNLTLHWGYEDNITSEFWCVTFPLCCGSQQSPINVDTSLVTPRTFNSNDKPFPLFSGLYSRTMGETVPVTVINTARTAEFLFQAQYSNATTVTGGCLGDDVFVFVAFHFHWGDNDDVGSEHAFDSRHFPLEMHLLHRNVKYATMDDAKLRRDGLAVVAVFFSKMSVPRSPLFATFASYLPYVHYAGQKKQFMASEVYRLLPDNTEKFYCYFGSLTTPTCNEAVTWTLLVEPKALDEEFLWQLRHLEQGDGPTDGGEDWPLVNNFRPVQPLNFRKVTAST